MWMVDDCFIRSCLLSYVSVIPFRMCLFSIIVFGLVIMDFDLPLLVGNKFFLVR